MKYEATTGGRWYPLLFSQRVDVEDKGVTKVIPLDEEDKTILLLEPDGSDHKNMIIVINESGLYSLIFRSKLDSAECSQWA